MAIVSWGYDGTITETQWAKLAASLGADFGVVGANDWKCTAVAGADRTVAVAAGAGYGWGVYDTSDAQVTLQCGVISSGTRWDLIAMRRNWAGTGGNSAFVVVPGTSAGVLPGARNINPGVLADQPVALVQLTAGQTAPSALVDLRAFSSKVMSVQSTLALPDAQYGATAFINGIEYRKQADGTWATATTHTPTQDWLWSGTAYSAGIGNTWAVAPGSARTVTLTAGHRYQFVSMFSVRAAGSGLFDNYSAALVVNGQTLRQQAGFASAGSSDSTVEMTCFYTPSVDGPITFHTQFIGSVGGARIKVSDQPASYIFDHGPL